MTALQGRFGHDSYYWIYCAKSFVGAFLVWLMWPLVKEMRWAFSWEAVAIGIFVAVFWVGLDLYCPKWFHIDHIYNPHADLGGSPAHPIGECSIQSNGNQKSGKSSEEDRKPGKQLLT